MTSMVEKVARAMVAADSGPEGSPLFEIHWREFGVRYKSSARAGIQAMREMTPEMSKAADIPGWDDSVTIGLGAEIWERAIDAALKEE